ncbi:hypothetical protein [Desulfosporosinus orientis]|nr:hypothetical protein [Desulfosporosinus orientis]
MRGSKCFGYISLLILLLLTVFSGLGMESYLKANAENRMVKRETQSRQALYLAEGGIEWAKAHLLVNSELRGGSLTFDTGHTDIQIEESGGEYTVLATGLSGRAVRKIEARILLMDGAWAINSYQELHR